MEARAEFDRTGISRLFVGVVLILVAVGFGIMAAYLAAGVTATSGASQQINSEPKVMRHDNGRELDQAPAAAIEGQPTGLRHGGLQE